MYQHNQGQDLLQYANLGQVYICMCILSSAILLKAIISTVASCLLLFDLIKGIHERQSVRTRPTLINEIDLPPVNNNIKTALSKRNGKHVNGKCFNWPLNQED